MPQTTLRLVLLCSLLGSLPLLAQTCEAYLYDGQIKGHILDSGVRIIASGEFTPNRALQAQLRSRVLAPRPVPPPGELTSDAKGLYDKLSAATVVIVNLGEVEGADDHVVDNAATGFVITEDGLVVTNYHVMMHASSVTYVAMLRDGRVVPVVEVVAALEAHDIAIVRLGSVQDAPLTTLPIARDAEVGERVHIVAHPDHRFWRYSSGEIARFFATEVLEGGPIVPRVDVTAEFAKGSSGGAIVNDRGQVVAVVSSTHSMYASEVDGQQIDHQMVFREAVPYEILLGMFGGDPDPALGATEPVGADSGAAAAEADTPDGAGEAKSDDR